MASVYLFPNVRRARLAALLSVLFVGLGETGSASNGTAQQKARAVPYSLDEVLAAIRAVESGGQPANGVSATGDGGRAIGPYQIHRAHWIDSGLGGKFEDCRNAEYARREVVAYWKRWCPEALARCDAEVLARIHNGGPDGARERCTLKYWRKVEAQLERNRALANQARLRNPTRREATPPRPPVPSA